ARTPSFIFGQRRMYFGGRSTQTSSRSSNVPRTDAARNSAVLRLHVNHGPVEYTMWCVAASRDRICCRFIHCPSQAFGARARMRARFVTPVADADARGAIPTSASD